MRSAVIAVENMDKIKVSLSVEKLPYNYTCDGEDISPGIDIKGVGPDVKSMALVMVDTNSTGGGNFPHWVMWNIDPAVIIPEKLDKKPVIDFPFNAVQGKNGLGKIGYNGPCPEKGNSHRYIIKVYGLDAILDLVPGSDIDELNLAMEGHVIAYGDTFLLYGR